MNKKGDLKRIASETLKINEEARKDDFTLIYEIYKGYGILLPQEFKEGKKNKLPTPESITRVRRKVQELHPEWTDDKTAYYRAVKEMAIRLNIVKEEL